MKNFINKMPVLYGIITGVGVSVFFILLEYFLVTTGISDCGLIVDSCLRIAVGVGALILMKGIYREQFGKLFTAKIPKTTWIYCIPFLLYLAVEFLYLPISDNLTFAHIPMFLLCCVQQITTGFWEEAASKGLVMSGMLSKWKYTLTGRLGMVFITGLLFGAVHILNFVFGNDIISCLWNALCCMAFGALLAAIYLHSENITLCMVIHAVWDIIIRIPNYFCEGINYGFITDFVDVSQGVIELGIFPLVTILICVMEGKRYKKGSLNEYKN